MSPRLGLRWVKNKVRRLELFSLIFGCILFFFINEHHVKAFVFVVKSDLAERISFSHETTLSLYASSTAWAWDYFFFIGN
jgi:hypothetical protein